MAPRVGLLDRRRRLRRVVAAALREVRAVVAVVDAPAVDERLGVAVAVVDVRVGVVALHGVFAPCERFLPQEIRGGQYHLKALYIYIFKANCG